MDVEYTSADSVWKEYCKTYLGVENDDLAEGFFHDSPLISSYYNVTVLNGNADKISLEIKQIEGVKNVKISQNESEEPLIN